LREGEFNLYVLDANVFIGAHRGYYAFDIAPSFWKTLVSLADDSKICSIDKIQQEIINPNDDDPDELQEWTSENFREYFEKTDASDVLQNYASIQQWAFNESQFTDAAKDEFARNADAWLISYAKAKGYTLVTHEVYNPESRKRILIPVVCEIFEVKCINTFEMLKDLQVQF
jgi:hypothetical protein